MLNIIFFTEAGTKRGMGHLIRSYTIYNEFKKNGIKSSFYLDSDINYDYKFNDIQYFKWGNFNYKSSYDVVVIDSYEANIDLYNKLAISSKLIVSIDDYGRLKYPKGFIINFAPEANKYFKDKENNYTYLLGLDYIPIRDNFLNLKVVKKEQIFIMLGGSDIKNLSVKIVDYLDNINIKKVVVTTDELTKNILNTYKNIKVLYKPTDDELAKYMAQSSIAISTASMSVYELAYFKIPTIIIAISKNQINGIKQLLKYKLAIEYINIFNEDSMYLLVKTINKNIKQITTQKQVIDGDGLKRIYNKIMEISL